MTEEMKDLIPYTQRKVADAHKYDQAYRRLIDALSSLHDRLHHSKLKIVLFDLLALAKLDGVIELREREFIDKVASRWGFKFSEAAYQKAA